MSEYKTYKCDYCGKLGAVHLTFPEVDYREDPADASRYSVPGYVDLCGDHMQIVVDSFIHNLSLLMAQQRVVWKNLANSRLKP